MAYSYQVFNHSGTGSYAGEEYSWADILSIAQTAANASTITIKVTRQALGNNIGVQPTTVTFSCNGQSLSHYFPGHNVPGYGQFWFTDEWDAAFPVSWSGKTVSWASTSGSYSGSFTFGGYGQFTLSITSAAKLPVTVKRTSSPKAGASIAALASGAAIYTGDVLQVTYTLAAGYKGQVKLNNVVISSGATHTVSAAVTIVSTAEPMATLHIWNGNSWDMYLIYVRGSSAWELHQVNIYDGSAWQKYF